jgi:hypothetical protein
MPIQKEIILRYQSSGHVRFQIPERLCSNEVASFVSDAINDFDGVYRVSLFRNKQKLAIRFTEESLNFLEKQLLMALPVVFCRANKAALYQLLFIKCVVYESRIILDLLLIQQPYLPGFLFVVVQNLYLKKGFFNAKPDTAKTSNFTKNFTLPNWKSTSWAKEKYTETKETAQAISILAK